MDPTAPIGVISFRNIFDTAVQDVQTAQSQLQASKTLGQTEVWIAIVGAIALLMYNRKR